MESADPSDRHKVAVVRVGNSVKFIHYMEEIEATADANVPARGPRRSGAGSIGQARLCWFYRILPPIPALCCHSFQNYAASRSMESCWSTMDESSIIPAKGGPHTHIPIMLVDRGSNARSIIRANHGSAGGTVVPICPASGMALYATLRRLWRGRYCLYRNWCLRYAC